MPSPELLAFEVLGGATRTRLGVAEDLQDVNAMHALCSLESRAARYLAGVPRLTHAMWAHLVDPARGTTWVTHQHGKILAVTHLMGTAGPGGQPDPALRELAILVRDDVQGHGLGTQLARCAVDAAKDSGARAVTLTLASTNRRMAAIARGLGAKPWTVTGPVSEVTIPCA